MSVSDSDSCRSRTWPLVGRTDNDPACVDGEASRERVAENRRPLGRGGVSRDTCCSPSTRVGCSRTGPAALRQHKRVAGMELLSASDRDPGRSGIAILVGHGPGSLSVGDLDSCRSGIWILVGQGPGSLSVRDLDACRSGTWIHVGQGPGCLSVTDRDPCRSGVLILVGLGL